MEKIFKPEEVRAGTKIFSATERSDVPLSFNAVSKLVIDAQTQAVSEDHLVIFVGEEIATVFENMAVDFENQGTFYGYIDPNTEIKSPLLGSLLGCPIYKDSEVSPYTLSVSVFHLSPDGWLDSVCQLSKDFSPETVNKE